MPLTPRRAAGWRPRGTPALDAGRAGPWDRAGRRVPARAVEAAARGALRSRELPARAASRSRRGAGRALRPRGASRRPRSGAGWSGSGPGPAPGRRAAAAASAGAA